MPLFVFNSRFSIIDMMRTLLLSLLFIPFFLRAEEKVDFNTQIKSLLSNRCIACHGPDEEHREAQGFV